MEDEFLRGVVGLVIFFFKQKTAYEMRISDWSSDVCSSDLIDREIGDPKHKPNPCLGPVEKAPFYAIKIYPGDGSTTVGLKIDEHCRVLDAQGDPLPGLYAAGLDANSIWRGKSPGHGCNVGPAMVLGYRSEEHTSELQSLMRISYAVFCLNKKTTKQLLR